MLQFFPDAPPAESLQLVEEAGLETGEAEIQVVLLLESDGEVVARGIPSPRRLGDGGTAGEAKAQHSGALVESLPGSVVEGLSEKIHAARGHGVEGGVAPGGYEGDEGRLQGGVGEVGGRDVAFKVVHGDQGKLSSEGQT